MPYLCSMYHKILCVALAFALSLSVVAEDLQSVMKFYKPDMSNGFIFVSKVDMTLTLVNSQGRVVVTYPMACGVNRGQKNVAGDHKTPEGYFMLEKIHDSSNWGHDFHDGKGFIKHAYGHYFLRLQTGFQGIGIHGTHDPASIGTRATEGCIRLENSNLEALEQKVTIGMPVIIGPEEGVAHLIATNAQRPDLPYWTTGGVRPSKPASNVAQRRKPKVVDGELDIDPEKDLTDALEAMPSVSAVVETVKVPEVKPVEPVVVKPVEPVAVKPVENPVVETPKVETPVVETPVVDTPVDPAVSTPSTPNDPVASTPAESTDKAPRYEVVVDELHHPDGTVKYVVRYIKK